MTRSLFIFLSFFLLHCTFSWAQTTDSLAKYQYEGIRIFALDPLQHLYAIDERGDLTKYDRNGKFLFNYHNTILGEIGSIDAGDPFNILLFFPEQQSIVLLDRTLGDRAQLDLRTTDIQNASAALRSHDGNIWVYDDFAGRLYQLNARGETLFVSNDFRLSEGLMDGATQLWRNGHQLLLNFPERGIAVLSLFGQLQEWWDFTAVDDGFLTEQYFYFRQAGVYQRYLPEQQVLQTIEWPEGEAPVQYRQQLKDQYLLGAEGRLRVVVE